MPERSTRRSIEPLGAGASRIDCMGAVAVKVLWKRLSPGRHPALERAGRARLQAGLHVEAGVAARPSRRSPRRSARRRARRSRGARRTRGCLDLVAHAVPRSLGAAAGASRAPIAAPYLPALRDWTHRLPFPSTWQTRPSPESHVPSHVDVFLPIRQASVDSHAAMCSRVDDDVASHLELLRARRTRR